MSARLRAVAEETERIVADGGYALPGGRRVSIEHELSAAVRCTRMYGPGPVAVEQAAADAGGGTRFEVTAEPSQAAARRLADEEPGAVGVLNFASARNPGGGYLNGARAQEEELCRASALYVTLLRAPEYYAAHRADRSPFYSDRVILSPGVPVFRDERGELLERPYTAGFLTAAAPNAGVIARRQPAEAGRIPQVLLGRSERVLEVAAAGGLTALVLGAWGCGVFRNDPADVAAAFRAHLTGGGRFAGRFARIVFAVWDRQEKSANRAAFVAEFGGT